MAQKKVTIVNIKKSSVDGKTHESTIFESLWIKEESISLQQGRSRIRVFPDEICARTG